MEKFLLLLDIIAIIGFFIGGVISGFFILLWVGLFRHWFIKKMDNLNRRFPRR
jgi:hypothetical protein